ncbi:unnamed protein product [Mytilus coruscus]|uniref:Uncharacterized protein n=1 Tax=Mytilus coruscus TaxID=42192 RepID=A0A6J8ALQ6_MYTCO|nr:unnamed protein product [Mytilus coruscus]
MHIRNEIDEILFKYLINGNQKTYGPGQMHILPKIHKINFEDYDNVMRIEFNIDIIVPPGRPIISQIGEKLSRREKKLNEGEQPVLLRITGQLHHDEVPRMQLLTSSAPGPFTSSEDLTINEEFVMPVFHSQKINELGTFQNFESNVNSVHEIPSISNDLGNNFLSSIRQKILNSEYIDLGCLLSNLVPIDDNSNTLIIKDGVLQS